MANRNKSSICSQIVLEVTCVEVTCVEVTCEGKALPSPSTFSLKSPADRPCLLFSQVPHAWQSQAPEPFL